MTNPTKDKFFYVSQAYEKVWGLSYASLYMNSTSFIDVIHPKDRPRITKMMFLQAQIMRADGERWIRVRALPIYNQAGEVYRIVGIAEDITERKQAEIEFNTRSQKNGS